MPENIEGWLKLYRAIRNSPLWLDRPFARGQAWIDLLLRANWENMVRVKWERGIAIPCGKGQLVASKSELAAAWGWSRRKVALFLVMLENAQQIAQQNAQQIAQQNINTSGVISILNWPIYQETAQQNAQQIAQQTFQQTHSKRTADSAVNKESIYNKNSESSSSLKKGRSKENTPHACARGGCVSAEAEKIFGLYPERDPISKRSTGKTEQDKQVIERMLREGYPVEAAVRFYLKDCGKSRTYIKNFANFLAAPPAVGHVAGKQAEREIIGSVQALVPKAKKENWNPTSIKTADVPSIGDNAFLKMIKNGSVPVFNTAQERAE